MTQPTRKLRKNFEPFFEPTKNRVRSASTTEWRLLLLLLHARRKNIKAGRFNRGAIPSLRSNNVRPFY